VKGMKLTLNLPFEIPSNDRFPFVSSLDEKYQEAIWLAEHALYFEEISDELSDHKQIIEDNLRGAELVLNSDFDGIVDYLTANEELKTDERISWSTLSEEEIESKIMKRSDWTNESAIARIQKRINEYRDILKNPRELVPEYFWEAEIEEGYHFPQEQTLLAHLVNFPEYQEITDRFHIFYGRDPENERAKSTHRANWSKAQELAKAGKTSMLLDLQKLSVEAETAVAAGKRITSQDGDCYVCGKFIPHFGGELILWNEIPKSYFYEHLGGNYQKWRVRHFSGECSLDKYGKRIQLVHIKGHTGYRNERADKCWLCEVDVPVDAGWLVLVDQIPKWKHSKRAFPGAREKKYYVQCEKVDE
jgi:hypothetical protein